MKLRIHHQEVRFRLSPSDLTHLETNDDLLDVLQFTQQIRWTYALRLGNSETSHVLISEDGHQLSVHLPRASFRQWLASPDIEWIIHQAKPELSILVEKDLKPNRS